MKFRHCPPRIALALPVLGALIAPTSAFPLSKNSFRQDKIPPGLEVVRERVNNPRLHYAEVPVELREGTAVPEPALVPNQPADDEVVDRVYDHEAQPLHRVASTIEGRFNASGNAEAEREPYEVEDIAPIEKRGVLPSIAGEDEESAQLVQPALSIPEEEEEEEEEQEAQAELDSPAVEEESDYPVQENGEDERLKEAWVNAPHRRHVAEPITTAKPHQPIPDRFNRHVKILIIPDNTTAAEDVDDVDSGAYLLNRFKTAPTTIGDTPDYAVPTHLLPEVLLDTEEGDQEEYLERRTTHPLTTLTKVYVSAPTVAPEAGAAETEAPASPTGAAPSASHVYITPFGHSRIARPVIQN